MRSTNLKPVVGSLLALALGFTGCSGDTDGGKAADEQFTDAPFVPTESNSGSIRLIVNETEMSIGDTSGFSVEVRDANGSPVALTRIACDSELGVAILEPTTGSEITDSNGQISGRIGCAQPGSLLFGCRLPVGANLRQFVTIKCQGDVPQGFDGFAGAAGGTLGSGGVDIDDSGGQPGVGSNEVRISSIAVRDDPSSPETDGVQIDNNQDICVADDPSTPANEQVVEPFGDTFLSMKIVNNTNSDIRFSSVRYTVPNANGSGTTFRSSAISFIGEVTAAADGGDVSLDALLFSATGAGADKFFVNTSSGNLGITSIGFRNVRFTVTGTNTAGETVTVNGETALSFSNYNRCTS